MITRFPHSTRAAAVPPALRIPHIPAAPISFLVIVLAAVTFGAVAAVGPVAAEVVKIPAPLLKDLRVLTDRASLESEVVLPLEEGEAAKAPADGVPTIYNAPLARAVRTILERVLSEALHEGRNGTPEPRSDTIDRSTGTPSTPGLRSGTIHDGTTSTPGLRSDTIDRGTGTTSTPGLRSGTIDRGTGATSAPDAHPKAASLAPARLLAFLAPLATDSDLVQSGAIPDSTDVQSEVFMSLLQREAALAFEQKLAETHGFGTDPYKRWMNADGKHHRLAIAFYDLLFLEVSDFPAQSMTGYLRKWAQAGALENGEIALRCLNFFCDERRPTTREDALPPRP